jgi:hypothetical protein
MMVKEFLKVLFILVLKLFFHFFKKLNPVIIGGDAHDGRTVYAIKVFYFFA